MPEMNGAELLETARRIVPDTVRVMLTGRADQLTAIDAVNRGEIFRFLNKPVKLEALRGVLELAARQYQLVTAERELLENTLRGSIKVLSEMLSIAKPEAFGRMDRLRKKSREIADQLEDISDWELDTAASLSLLGCVALPPELLSKVLEGAPLNAAEQREYQAHPALAAELLRNIPRMDGVADIVLYQHKSFDGTGFPADLRSGHALPVGARILNVVLAYDDLSNQGWSDRKIYDNLRRQSQLYDPRVLKALEQCLEEADSRECQRLPLADIREGMTIEEDIRTSSGMLLVCKGHIIKRATEERLRKLAKAGLLDVQVLVSTENA